ncbi:N-6 DNA methylase [Pseudomonas sp. Tri1]|uniref:HsdM family class I SAM-dependent methyltransferase n=1 Tax=Pseudomonas sp. Tri1 TaxID=2823875 RepID=UPI001B33FAB6|nr:N-6 DNA methylase [Pseudomonas sp. Tri1]
MATTVTPLMLTCPIRGLLKPKKKASTDLSALEERHRIDAIRYCLSLGYDPKRIKIEAVIAKFGNGGKNSFRCDFAILDVEASCLDMTAPDSLEEMLKHAIVLVEVKRDDHKADYVRKTQVEPLLNFAPRKDSIALYWDGINPRVFWKEDTGTSLAIKSGPLALLPKPGKTIKAKALVHADLIPPDSLLEVFSRIEDVLHGASVSLEERYELMLQLILAKIYDEHERESDPTSECVFQDYESIGTNAIDAANSLNSVLESAVSFYSAHLPKAIEDRFQVNNEVLAYCGQIMAPHLITAANKEVIQTFYMKFAKDLYRWDLAQYFTPPTVTDFIVEALNPVSGELVKDPACGSADFLVATFHRSRDKKIKNPADMLHGADDDKKAVQISVLNMLLNGDGKTNIQKQDSLLAVAADRAEARKDKKFKPVQYHNVVCNPPFGVKIVEKRREVLKEFSLGHVWSKDAAGEWRQSEEVLAQQEKGLLFAEVCVHQARAGGRIAIIVPNGYLGNRSDRYVAFREWLLRQCRIVSVCGFPRFTFKTSGADVSASVLYLEKRAKPLSSSDDDQDYMFNAELIENVGWSVGDNKALPTYLRDELDGSYIVGSDGKKVIKSDFESALADMRSSPAVAQFPWMVKSLGIAPHGSGAHGWAVSIENVLTDPTRTLDPKRHSRKYAALVAQIQSKKHLPLTSIFEVISQGTRAKGTSFQKKDEELYAYIDIDSMGAGEYRATPIRGWQLPARGRHLAGSLDVFIGSIWSSVTKWCLIEQKPAANLVVTNGCHRLRLKEGMRKYLVDVCVFLCSETYATQMRALARGSDGLAEIHEADLSAVLVPILSDAERKTFEPLVQSLMDGTGTLRGTVQEMLISAKLNLPQPAPRPHHSALV